MKQNKSNDFFIIPSLQYSSTPSLQSSPLPLRILSPKFGEKSLVDQLLHQTVIEELFRLGLFRFRISLGNLVQGHLKRLCLYQRNLFHEIIAVLNAAIEHGYIIDLGILGEDRPRFL